MRQACIALLVIFRLLFAALPCSAGDFDNALSLQGYTGLLNTPNAETTADGKFAALYSNQKERDVRTLATREDNYFFSVGLLPFVEFGGRIIDAPGAGIRDLSANVKIRVPGIPQGYYLPDIAFGMQDPGGGSKHLQTNYIVATETLGPVRLSVGAGTGNDRMKGAFGGVEVRLIDWLTVIGENDAKETNIGARIVSPDVFGLPVALQATVKTTLDNRQGSTAVAVGLQLPLGNERLSRQPVPEKTGSAAEPAPPEKQAAPAEGTQSGTGEPVLAPVPSGEQKDGKKRGPSSPALLAGRLVRDGFQNVRVGTVEGSVLLVEYENGRYNHNELDGLGVVVGIVADTVPPGEYETLRLILRKQDIAVLQISARLEDFRAFLQDPGAEGRLLEHLVITGEIGDEKGVNFIGGDRNSSWPSSALVLYPGLKTFVATEVGVFDYLVSAKIDYYVNVWKGAAVNARWDVPVAWSENFNDGNAFSSSRQDTQLDRLMLFQAIRPAPGLLVNLGGGMVLHNSYGTLNEVVWSPGDGTHRFSFKQARAENTDEQVQPHVRETYLGSYRYWFNPLNLSLEGTAGRFFDNDQGFRFEMKRFFGDTAFSVYYVNSVTPAQERVQIGGVMIALPLTPRRDMKPGLLQLRGSNDWSYSQETKIVGADEVNTVSTSVGVDPKPPFNIAHIFYNRDRLSSDYITTHLLRLRDAYITYLQAKPSEDSARLPDHRKAPMPAPLNPFAPSQNN